MDYQQPLSDFSYTLHTKHDDYKQSIIEKSGIKGQFKLSEIEAHEAKMNKVRSELKGQIVLSQAQAKNIEENHAFVLKMTDQELFTASLYRETTSTALDCAKKLEQVEALLAEYEKEKNLILEVLGLPKAEIPVVDAEKIEPVEAESSEPSDVQS